MKQAWPLLLVTALYAPIAALALAHVTGLYLEITTALAWGVLALDAAMIVYSAVLHWRSRP